MKNNKYIYTNCITRLDYIFFSWMLVCFAGIAINIKLKTHSILHRIQEHIAAQFYTSDMGTCFTAYKLNNLCIGQNVFKRAENDYSCQLITLGDTFAPWQTIEKLALVIMNYNNYCNSSFSFGH